MNKNNNLTTYKLISGIITSNILALITYTMTLILLIIIGGKLVVNFPLILSVAIVVIIACIINMKGVKNDATIGKIINFIVASVTLGLFLAIFSIYVLNIVNFDYPLILFIKIALILITSIGMSYLFTKYSFK